MIVSKQKLLFFLQRTFSHLFFVFVKEDVAAATRRGPERKQGSVSSEVESTLTQSVETKR